MNQPNPFTPLARLIEDQPRARDICDKCHRPCHKVVGTEFGEAWVSWHHDEVADDVFCGIAGRSPRVRYEQARALAWWRDRIKP